MIKKKRYLITTADELTWKFDQPVIFLGEWCRLYDRKHIWQGMNSIVAKPYGLSALKKDTDYFNAKMLEEKLFPELCVLLNGYHGTQHDERFWSIITGHWFRAIVQLLLNRTNTLLQCLQTDEIYETTVYNSEYSSLASPNWTSAFNSFDNDQWNNVLNGRILSLLNNANISLNYHKKKDSVFVYQGFKYKALNNELSFKRKVLKWTQTTYSKIARRFIKNEDAFIMSSYLPAKEEVKLELSLGQWPQMWNRFTPKIDLKPDQILRKNLTKKFEHKSENYLENIIRTLLFELLPVYYLEAQQDLKKIVNELPWPKSPKFIFTSNNFNTDEIFKLWTAIKVESGAKYYVGQHGCNYFTKKNEFPRIEEKTPDKFFTWGWTNELPKYIPAFIFKTAGRKPLNYNINGRLLLIETIQSIRMTTWDSTSEHNEYFKDQKNFVSRLSSTPRQKLTIRLHALYQDRKYNEDHRWKDFDRSIKVDKGKIAIKHLISDSRLVVHSYDSTGILETLSQNIPTLAFWQNNLDHLRDEVKPYYQLLIDSGILHLSSKSASSKVNEIWDNVDVWWNKRDIQEARKNFCDRLIKNSKNPVKKMTYLLTAK